MKKLMGCALTIGLFFMYASAVWGVPQVDENGCPKGRQGKNTLTKKWALCEYKVDKNGLCHASQSGCPTVKPAK